MNLYTSKPWRVPETIEKDKDVFIAILKFLLQPLHDVRIMMLLLFIGIILIITGIIIVIRFYRKISLREVQPLLQS